MNNVIMRKIVLTAAFQPLAGSRTVASFTVSVPPSNSGDALFQGDGGAEVPWVPGEWHDFHSVDLAAIRVKGNSGDIVTVVGGTW